MSSMASPAEVWQVWPKYGKKRVLKSPLHPHRDALHIHWELGNIYHRGRNPWSYNLQELIQTCQLEMRKIYQMDIRKKEGPRRLEDKRFKSHRSKEIISLHREQPPATKRFSHNSESIYSIGGL